MLGALWLVLQPLAMILVYTVIFAEVMKSRMPGVNSTFGFSIYLCAGVLTWGLFAEIVSRAQSVFIENANVLKKLSFPRIALPVIVALSAMMNFLIIFSLFTIFLVVSGNFPGVTFLGLIPLLLVQIVFSVGLGITVGVLNVFFRDVGQFMTILRSSGAGLRHSFIIATFIGTHQDVYKTQLNGGSDTRLSSGSRERSMA